jgi:plastocyanin
MERSARRRVGKGDEVGREPGMKRFGRVVMIVMVAVAGLLPAHASAEHEAAVDIQGFKFMPPVLTVPVGTRVTWTNHDEEPHTITSAQGAFGSTGLSHDEQFSRTFERAGRYDYFCALHPHMKATVIVR